MQQEKIDDKPRFALKIFIRWTSKI